VTPTEPVDPVPLFNVFPIPTAEPQPVVDIKSRPTVERRNTRRAGVRKA